ncbi:MAG: magnesium transporter CorA, partial [Chloroflexi bacterium]|nr:magnesium transporter CorA [Chloroflexota bacterium]
RGRDLLNDLVALRRRIARLRRSMVAHRGVYGALTGPDVRQVVDDQDAVEDLTAVSARFDAAIAAVEGSREALIGSFDVYMSRTAQRTNDVMKVLTIATVLLLPGSVIAGLLGMKVVVPLDKDSPYSFWIVIAGVATLAVILLVVARHRRWL